MLHHPAEPWLRCGDDVLACRLDASHGERQRRDQRGHHPPPEAMVLCAVPPGGSWRPHGHRVLVPLLCPQHLGAGGDERDYHPVLLAGAPAEGLGPRFRRLDDRPGRRVRLLGQSGDQGVARERRPVHLDQPEHRHSADIFRLCRPCVLLAGDPRVRHSGHQARAPGRHSLHLRRTDGSELRGEDGRVRRLREVQRAGHGYPHQGDQPHRGPRALRRCCGPLRLQGGGERLLLLCG
mmetsp:Transcript_29981/g.86253  ORF Transcript_29981/g.86253 Transcript_29981/m.86253 type:complete len:236 (-) Transcript_29981:3098-3805(-)